MDLDYRISVDYHDGYGIKQHLKRVSKNKFFNTLITSPYSLVSTIVDRGVWYLSWLAKYRAKFIAVLDCDGIPEMLAAKTALNTYGIGHAIVMSSPDHFWIITDYINIFSEAIKFIESMPGVDEKFVNFCKAKSIITMRAEALYNRFPTFPESNTLTDPTILEWYTEFKKHFEHPLILKKYNANCLKGRLSDGSFLQDMADPTFQI